MNKNAKIYIAGHTGLVGSAIVRKLRTDGYNNLVFKTREQLNLLDQKAVLHFFEAERPEYVFLAAAKVGGIVGNMKHPADFIYENLTIETNIIHAAYKTNVAKLLFLGSSCIYPKVTPQPIKEEYLLTGPLEETNKYYAVAKIAGLLLCEAYNTQYNTNFIAVMPTNLYGPNDNFHPENSHVLPALLQRFISAKRDGHEEVTVWGTGSARREFLHVNDMADACIFLMNTYSGNETINIGTGNDVSIRELAEMIKEVSGFEGEIVWDDSKPNGTPVKRLDVQKLHDLGWRHTIELSEGLQQTYQWYIENESALRKT